MLGSAVLLASLLGCSQTSADSLAQARSLIQRQDRSGAVLQLKSLIQEHPKLAEARLLLGGQLLDNGDPVAADIELQRALDLGQPEWQVVPLQARALLLMGQYGKLIGQFGNRGWPNGPATADLQTSVAQAHAALGNLPAARSSLAQALQAGPAHESARLLQARLVAAGGDIPAALQHVQQWLLEHPKSADAWLLRGDLLARSRHGKPSADTSVDTSADTSAAVQAWTQAVALQPGRPEGHVALISAQIARQDVAAAETLFAAMQQALPQQPQTRLMEGQIALLKGDLPQANAIFQALLNRAPDNLVLLQSAAVVALRMKSSAQAETLLTKALQIAPDSASVRRLLAQALLGQGQSARALGILEPLLGKTSTDAQALSQAAQAKLLDGNVPAANALFERAAKARPDDAQIRTAVALGHLATATVGSAQPALDELQAVALADSGTSADLALVSAQLRRHDFAAALAAVAAIERKQPGKPLAPQLRGQVLLQQQDTVAARAAFEQAVARDAGYFPAAAALAALDLADKQPAAAQARFDALLQHSPGNTQARLAVAALALHNGAPRDAVATLLDDAVKAQPTQLAARLALVDHHLGTANPKAALVAAQAGLAALPDNTELLGRLARAQLASGEHQQAITTYTRVASLLPKSAAGPLGLAEAQLAANDLVAAQRSVKRALDLVPDALPAQRLAIRLALRQHQPAAALALARTVQRQRPTLAEGYVLEGEIHLADKHPDLGLAALRKATTLDSPGQAAARLHQALQGLGKAAEADAFATSWQISHPADGLFLFYLGDLALAQKNHALAEQRYRAVLKLLPEHALSLNNIAWLLLAQHKPGALAYAERAVKAAPNMPALMDTLALASAADGQLPRAITLQKQVLAMRPDDPFLRLNLARFYAQAGEKRLAKAELDRLAALGERFPQQAEAAALLKRLGGR